MDLLGDSDGEEKGFADIKVNNAYAQRFAHNKQREALHKLQELKKKGLAGDSDEDGSCEDDEEEDEDGYIPEKTELQFYETLAKVKKKDPLIYKKDVKLYEDDDDEEVEEKRTEEGKKKKTLYLKDVMAQHLIENGPEFDNEDEIRKNVKRRGSMSYAEEQDELKRAFLIGVQDDDDSDDGGLLTVRKKTAEELKREKKEEEEAGKEAEQRAKDADIARRLDDYFGKDDDLDDSDRFLKSYLLNKGWIEREEKGSLGYGDVGVSEDEEELEKQDRFEAGYNFRFEEGAGDQVLGHARFTDGSVRKKPNSRKQQREKKKERLAQAEFERKEELKQLKNIKKKEIMEKLERIRHVAGIRNDQGNVLEGDDLDEDFDPDEYDRKMREAFGDKYYGTLDPDENFEGYDEYDLEKPDFDAEDDLLGLPKGWDGRESKGGFAAVRENVKKLKNFNEHSDAAIASEEEEEEEEREEEEGEKEEKCQGYGDTFQDNMGTDPEEASKNRKRRKAKISLRERLSFDKQLEEYYKLDYEDMIGDLPTRFKYREVPSNNYRLSTEEILLTDDKELNQYVSLKKLAPYRTEEWKPPKHNRFSQKKRKIIALHDGKFSFAKGMKKVYSKGKGHHTHARSLNGEDGYRSKETDGEVESKSKKKRRRQKKAPIIPPSRLLAYGKGPNRRTRGKKS